MKFIFSLLPLSFWLPLAFGQPVLQNIEHQLLDAYGQSVQTEQDQFQPMVEKLENEWNQGKDPMVHYWWCFALYRQSIYQMNSGEEEHAFKTLKRGIESLKALQEPNSEELVLLATMLSLSINFQPQQAIVLSAEAAGLYEKAIRKNDQNLRAYLGAGRSDFYKPVQYGGGQKVETYLKKALTKPDASTKKEHAPIWGRDEVYYYLAGYYQRENRLDEARLYCIQGLKAFPDHPRLSALKAKLQ